MTPARVLYDGFAVTYAVSLVLYFLDIFAYRHVIGRTALAFQSLAFALETIVLFSRLMVTTAPPVYTRSDLMLLLCWLILLISIVVNGWFRVNVALFGANAVGFLLLISNTFVEQGRVIYPARQIDLLVLHIALALLSYVCFAFAFVYSFLYLVEDRWLRERRWHRLFSTLPALGKLDLFAFRAVVIGFPLLLVSMLLGIVWGRAVLHQWVVTDPTPVATLVTWIMYGFYLVLRVRAGWGGKALARFNIICAVAVFLNVFVVSDFSAFHRAG